MIIYTAYLQILPRLIKQAKGVYVDDELPPDCVLKKLGAFKEADEEKKVRSIQRYAFEPRWIKSPAEINLMRHSASIASQVGLPVAFELFKMSFFNFLLKY